ncbi:serine aminopeptidase domain-containing protein, partial [Rhizobium ruizarguesonis]
FLEKVVLPDTRLPFYLLAHSTGGLIALSAAPYLTTRIDRMVLSAPFIGQHHLFQECIEITLVIGKATCCDEMPLRPHLWRPWDGC